jgi:membrane peptidoglycan carboxypeptidase
MFSTAWRVLQRPWAFLRRHVRGWRRWVAIVLAAIVAVSVAGIYVVDRLPLPNPHPLVQATLVYDARGNILATFSEQNRVSVKLAQVPPVVADAVVSTEDRHFWSEGALNPVSIGRAFFSDLRGSGGLQGGSTITQQYVKEAYLSPKRTLVRKIEEALLAIRLSHVESKREILENYLNTIYWGRGAYGVEAASEAYFGKHVWQLGLREASLLAGLIREPTSADPAVDATQARINQDDSLQAMLRDKKITKAQAAAVEATPFARYVVKAKDPNAAFEEAPGAAYFASAVRQQLYAKFGTRVVDGGGLRVYTSFDPVMQTEAYDSLYGKDPQALHPSLGDPSAALVSLDNNGDVKALVGGWDYAKSSVDLALGRAGGGSGRQAGSTFKAFMLAEIVKEGYSLRSVLPSPPRITFPHVGAGGTAWTVENFEGETPGRSVNLIDATALSVNTVYAQLVMKIGAEKLVKMAESLGIQPSELPGAVPSEVLGTASVSPLDMAAAYATFADGGVYHTPVLITRITKSNGAPLPLPVAPKHHTVLSEAQAAKIDYVLQQVVARGTGTAAGNLPSQVAGKTGTTEHSSDAWFVGYTPKLTTAVWMGYATSERPMVDFRGLASIQGGTIPAELWHDYMAAVLRTYPSLSGAFPTVTDFGGPLLSPPPKRPPALAASPPTTTVQHAPGKSPPTTVVQGPPPTNPPPTTTLPPPTTTTTVPTTTTKP